MIHHFGYFLIYMTASKNSFLEKKILCLPEGESKWSRSFSEIFRGFHMYFRNETKKIIQKFVTGLFFALNKYHVIL